MNEQGVSVCIAGWWPEPGGVTGIFIREHVKAIATRRPVEVVFVQVIKHMVPWPAVEHTTAVEEGILVRRITIRTPLRRFGFPEFIARLVFRRLLARIRRTRPIAVVHIHVRTELTEQAVPASRAMGIPIVLTEHNSFYHLGIRDLPGPEQARQRAAIRRWLSNDAIVHIMPVSHDLARVLEQDYGVAGHRMTVVRNVAAKDFVPPPTPPQGRFRMLLAAVWRPPKDHDVFIRALALLPTELRMSCMIEWAGFGPDMERIRQRCADELPGVDILFPGQLNKAGLARAMQAAHLFVLPTKADNQPCVVLESLCCGTPVVSMAVNGVPEMIGPDNGLLVPPGDPAALAGALAECISGSATFDRWAIAKAAQDIYSQEAIGAAIEAVYQQAPRIPQRT